MSNNCPLFSNLGLCVNNCEKDQNAPFAYANHEFECILFDECSDYYPLKYFKENTFICTMTCPISLPITFED